MSDLPEWVEDEDRWLEARVALDKVQDARDEMDFGWVHSIIKHHAEVLEREAACEEARRLGRPYAEK